MITQAQRIQPSRYMEQVAPRNGGSARPTQFGPPATQSSTRPTQSGLGRGPDWVGRESQTWGRGPDWMTHMLRPRRSPSQAGAWQTAWEHKFPPAETAIRRRLAGEVGTIVRDWGGRLPVALVYPNTYHVGMSSLAVHALYQLFNRHDDVVCERAFLDHTPLALESQRPLTDFVVLAFTVSYELDYFNLVAILRAAGIPPLAAQRDDRHPLVIAGGPAPTANPLPLAPICDAVALGDGEVIIPPLLDALRTGDHAALAAVPGLYTSNVKCQTSGAIHNTSNARRQTSLDLDALPVSTVIYTDDTGFGDMALVEVSRGCGRGCRFCLTGHCLQPPRERSLDVLLRQAEAGLRHRARIGLVGAAVSDYSRIDDLVMSIRALGGRIAVSSLRADSLSEPLLTALAESGVQTLTLAPEAGSQRLRDAIRKGLTEDEILHAADLAQAYRFRQLKLYFMVGLPGETDADVTAIAALCGAVRERFRGGVTATITPFVPKAGTPFQWAAMTPVPVLQARLKLLARDLRRRGVRVHLESADWAAVQGVLSRGDERVGRALAACTAPTQTAWREALLAHDVDPARYLGAWPLDEPLPWDTVDLGTDRDLLRREYLRGCSRMNTDRSV